MLLQSFPHFV
jgi:glycyl-tRNA synthetase